MKGTRFIVALALVGFPLSAAAQGTAPTVRKEPKWTFEVLGGAAMSSAPGSGSGSAAPGLPVGASFTTEGGTPSRAVPSWYFGDGATLFNQVRQQFAALGQQFPGIIPLDEALGSSALSRGTGATFGVRLSRQLTSRVALEVSVQNSQGSLSLSDEARDGIEAARESFETAFTGLFGTMPQTNLQVTSAATLPGTVSGSQGSVTGALRISLVKSGRMDAYVTAGAGRVTNSGEVATVTMRGAYQFRFLDTYAFSEVDNVTIRYSESKSSTIGVFGGGVAFDLSSRQGVRLDLRVHAGDSTVKTTLQASPVNNASLPAVGLPSITSPSIQFSNTAALKSSLSGPLAETDVFNGSGMETRVLATIGYYFRF